MVGRRFRGKRFPVSDRHTDPRSWLRLHPGQPTPPCSPGPRRAGEGPPGDRGHRLFTTHRTPLVRGQHTAGRRRRQNGAAQLGYTVSSPTALRLPVLPGLRHDNPSNPPSAQNRWQASGESPRVERCASVENSKRRASEQPSARKKNPFAMGQHCLTQLNNLGFRDRGDTAIHAIPTFAAPSLAAPCHPGGTNNEGSTKDNRGRILTSVSARNEAHYHGLPRRGRAAPNNIGPNNEG